MENTRYGTVKTGSIIKPYTNKPTPLCKTLKTGPSKQKHLISMV